MTLTHVPRRKLAAVAAGTVSVLSLLMGPLALTATADPITGGSILVDEARGIGNGGAGDDNGAYPGDIGPRDLAATRDVFEFETASGTTFTVEGYCIDLDQTKQNGARYFIGGEDDLNDGVDVANLGRVRWIAQNAGTGDVIEAGDTGVPTDEPGWEIDMEAVAVQTAIWLLSNPDSGLTASMLDTPGDPSDDAFSQRMIDRVNELVTASNGQNVPEVRSDVTMEITQVIFPDEDRSVITVLLVDNLGNPVPNVELSFEVVDRNGAVQATHSETTDADGQVELELTGLPTQDTGDFTLRGTSAPIVIPAGALIIPDAGSVTDPDDAQPFVSVDPTSVIAGNSLNIPAQDDEAPPTTGEPVPPTVEPTIPPTTGGPIIEEMPFTGGELGFGTLMVGAALTAAGARLRKRSRRKTTR